MTDHGLVLSLVPGYTAPMEPAEIQFVNWMIEQFRLRPDLSQSDLARHLGVHRNIVYKMLKGLRKRGITVSERAAIQQFFGCEVAEPTLRLSTLAGQISVRGPIGSHLWETEVTSVLEMQIGSPILDYPLDEQTAHELGASSPDGEYRKADVVYSVPFDTYRPRLLRDDVVIARRRKNGLVNYTLARAVPTNNGAVALEPILAGSDTRETLAQSEIVGLVIGTYRPRPRR